MFVRRSPILASDKPQPAVLLVKELLVEGSPDGRGSESNLLPQETRVIHQTLADLSQLPPDLITHIERYCAAAADAEKTAQSAGIAGLQPAMADSSARLPSHETTGWKPVIYGRQDASPPANATDADQRSLEQNLWIQQIELELQNEELRRTLNELETSRQRYFDLYDLAPVGYLTLDQTGLILEANLTSANLLGLERGRLTGRRLSSFISKEDLDRYNLIQRQVRALGDPKSSKLRMVKKDGSSIWVKLGVSFVCDIHQDTFAYRCVLTDITQYQLAQDEWNAALEQQVAERTRELAEGKERFHLLADASFEGVAIVDNGIVLDCNRRFAGMHGYDVEEMLGRPVVEFVAPESRHSVAKGFNDSQPHSHEVYGLRKDGSIFPTATCANAGPWMGHTVRIVTVRDLTEVRAAEAGMLALRNELADAHQLALVGDVSTGVLQQLSQALTGLGTNLSVLLKLKAGALEPSGALGIINELDAEVKRMRDMVARCQQPHPIVNLPATPAPL